MGVNFLDLPFSAVKYGGPSGYWSIVIAFLLIIPVVLVMIALHKRFPSRNLFEVAPDLIGKPLSYLGNFLFLAAFLIHIILAFRDEADLIDIYLLNRTPLFVIMIVLLLCIGYAAVNGLSAVIRFTSFLLIPAYILRLFIEVLTFQSMKTSHLLPLFSQAPTQYLLGGLALTGYFLPITTFFLLSNRLKKPAKAGKAIFGALGGIFPVYLLAFIGTVGNFGAEYTLSFAWPEIAATNHINIPYLVLEQAGLLFLIIWITTFFATKTLFIYIVASGLKTQFPKLKYRSTVVILLLLTGILAMLFPNSLLVREIFTAIRPWLMVPLVGYPILVYLAAVIRGQRGGLENEV
jgi:spore germination protein